MKNFSTLNREWCFAFDIMPNACITRGAKQLHDKWGIEILFIALDQTVIAPKLPYSAPHPRLHTTLNLTYFGSYPDFVKTLHQKKSKVNILKPPLNSTDIPVSVPSALMQVRAWAVSKADWPHCPMSPSNKTFIPATADRDFTLTCVKEIHGCEATLTYFASDFTSTNSARASFLYSARG